MVAGWTDIFVARRMVNYRNFGYNTVAYTMFNYMKDIRDLDVAELSEVLGSKLAELEDGFAAVPNLRLTQRNGNHIKYLLARISAWLEAQCGGTLTFEDLVSRTRRHPFEIEHIWAKMPERHPEFPTEEAFLDQRNGFGGLLLLPKDFNASYGARLYPDKLDHYFGQNVLARSLHPKCYEHNPTFLRLRDQYSLAFSPIPGDFTVLSFSEREELYRQLCEIIWNPGDFGIEFSDMLERTPAQDRQQRYYGVTVKDLVDAGLLHPGQRLTGTRNDVARTATVTADGEIELEDGRREGSPSTAGAAALGATACNGWHFWWADTPRGLVRLTRVRDDFLERERR
jgi:Restriction Enzyme Adenine Methylase Associated/Protein of unknown function (DUF1524)